jgi:hypothetical protein
VAAPDRRHEATSRARDVVRSHEVVAFGILTGIAGGVAMLAIAMLGAMLEDVPVLHPLEVIGESFVGPEALEGAAKVAFGALVHLATSAALGILLAAILPRDFPGASALGVGVGFALFTLMFMMPAVVPWANPGFRGAMQDLGGTWVLAHAAYGLVVGTGPALRRRLVPEAPRATAPGAERALPRATRVPATTRTT